MLLGVAALLSSCSISKNLGTIDTVTAEAESKNWEYLGEENACTWYAVESLGWEIEFCYGNDSIVDEIHYYLPKEQGLQFYLYLDYYEGNCENDVCKNKNYTYTFFEDEDTFVVVQSINK